jgi:hypothetical protein
MILTSVLNNATGSFIQRCIALPIPLYQPTLPEQLSLTLNLKQHADGVRPFLDTLPKPFSWLVETESFTDFISNANYLGSQIMFEEYAKLAQDLKNKGNAAFAKGDRKAAVEAYDEGIMRGKEALNTMPAEDKKKQMFALLSVIHSNLAATYLMPGEGMDVEKALIKANIAEHTNPSYAKA